MSISALLFQAINGLAAASSLFLVAAGLSLIFGVTRIVNFAHGSLYMLGTYIAWSVATRIGGGVGYWGAVLIAALCVGAIGLAIETLLLRRIYRAPELYQLLATFALVLILSDAALAIWGAEDLLGPRAPGLTGTIDLLGRRLPQYDLVLIVAGPLVLGALHLMLARTRFGRLVRAATQDREMVAALGVNQAVLFSAVFALGAFLAGLGGALQLAREPATLTTDLAAIGDAFVVVVVGGLGSIPGAYVAAIIIAEVKALCIALGVVELFGISINMSKLTLVAEFIVMAIVLVARPHGLFGRPQSQSRPLVPTETPLRPSSPLMRRVLRIGAIALAALPFLAADSPYLVVLGIDVAIAVLFAASLHMMMGPGGLVSFGHAAFFGLGAYAAALTVKTLALPMAVALVAAPLAAFVGALICGWFAVRLSGVYLAMLTLAFAQIVWAGTYQWETLTGGSNGIVGLWPPPPFDARAALYWLALALVVLGVALLRRLVFTPFGYALRAVRDAPARADAVGIDGRRVQWLAFALAGAAAGVAGGLFAFAKGSISPETIGIPRSVDALVMVLLGGVQSLMGPLVGASAFTLLQDTVMRQTEYWRALLGAVILALVLLFPGGLVGGFAGGASALWSRIAARRQR